ncbi:MAG: zinc-dependent metalloprotease [Salinibacter sp.]
MRHVLPALLCAFLFTSCGLLGLSSDSSDPAAEMTATPETDDDDPFEDWDETLEDTEEIDGFLPLHQKEDRTVYAEIDPDRLGETFGLVMHISQGVGVFNMHDGLPLSDTRLMEFEKVGHKVHLVHRNPRFRADAGPMRRSLEDNTGHSTVQAFDIVSRNDSTDHLLIELSDFLVSEYPQVGERLKLYFGSAAPTLDREKSTVSQAMGFPENTEIDASLSFEGSEPPLTGAEAVPDYRAVPVGVRYSFFDLPEEPMPRRPADDRVGYFVDAVKDFSKDQERDPYDRYVQRWRLAPSDTAAYRRGERVEPEEPIVFYVDRSVPERYRPYVEDGIEAWNEAFRAAGYKNAVKAKPAPDDSTWSAEDIRYSTVRWTAAHDMGYAIGPSQTDPRTGEILNADILISSSFVRGWQNTYSQLTPEAGGQGPVDAAASPRAGEGAPEEVVRDLRPTEALRQMFPEHLSHRVCTVERGMAHQLGLQRALLLGRGTLDPGAPMPEEYLGAAVKDLVMHEVGHTLGLRHNFKASSGIPADRLHDESYTEEHGVSLSVMDYAPVNVALDPEEQGHYWNPNVGTYDEWAIQYGYQPIAEQSGDGPLVRDAPLADTMTAAEPGLNKIAAESSDPMHRYGTDEDAALGAYAVDPLTNTWELGSDPLAFADTRTDLVRDVEPILDDRLIEDGERYHALREATTALLVERYRSLQPVVKAVGGSYVTRDHKGTPDARPPFEPVAPDTQRQAVDLLVEHAFAPDAFEFDAERLNKLAPDRHSHWGASGEMPLDYPVHRRVATIQTGLLEDLMHPARLQRMIDTEVRTEGEPYGPDALLGRLTDAIWQEVGPEGRDPESVNSFRRPLQRTYTDRLVQLMMNTTSWITISAGGIDQIDTPEDVRSLARRELQDVSAALDRALADPGLDRASEAHLAETKERIDRALKASMSVSP